MTRGEVEDQARHSETLAFMEQIRQQFEEFMEQQLDKNVGPRGNVQHGVDEPIYFQLGGNSEGSLADTQPGNGYVTIRVDNFFKDPKYRAGLRLILLHEMTHAARVGLWQGQYPQTGPDGKPLPWIQQPEENIAEAARYSIAQMEGFKNQSNPAEPKGTDWKTIAAQYGILPVQAGESAPRERPPLNPRLAELLQYDKPSAEAVYDAPGNYNFYLQHPWAQKSMIQYLEWFTTVPEREEAARDRLFYKEGLKTDKELGA